jgi:hypothetical protein
MAARLPGRDKGGAIAGTVTEGVCPWWVERLVRAEFLFSSGVGSFGDLGTMPDANNPDDRPFRAIEESVWGDQHFPERKFREFGDRTPRVREANQPT